MKVDTSRTCDVLVVGAGLAGLRAAYDCAAAGLETLVIAKGGFCSGSSFYPLTSGLGSQLPKDEADKPVFLEEVLKTGAGAADEELVRVLIDDITAQTARLPQLGIEPTVAMLTGRPACFAETRRKLSVWRGWSDIRTRARGIFSGVSGLKVLENCDLLRIVKTDGRVSGALICTERGELAAVHAPCVILASGGYCGLYKHSLNTPDVAGAGQSAALDAGAELINLEFMQFIPGLTAPRYKALFNEYSLVHVIRTENDAGEDVLGAMLPAGVSLRECLDQRAMHGPFTSAEVSRWFDLAMMKDAIGRRNEKGFTLFYDDALLTDDNQYLATFVPFMKSLGVDLARQRISIGSFAHCANGGVRIDADGAARVPGLFACGEAAGGVHGADRHGGLASACCLVFGARAAAAAARYRGGMKAVPGFSDAAEAAALADWFAPGSGGVSAAEAKAALGETLWYDGNVLRSGPALEAARARVCGLRETYSALRAAESGEGLRSAAETFHALRLSEALLDAMLLRRESRGPHYRADFPAPDPSLYGKRIAADETEGKIAAAYL